MDGQGHPALLLGFVRIALALRWGMTVEMCLLERLLVRFSCSIGHMYLGRCRQRRRAATPIALWDIGLTTTLDRGRMQNLSFPHSRLIKLASCLGH